MPHPYSASATVRPPSWAEAILRVLVPREQEESITGDLLEEYRASKVPVVGVSRANRWYMMQVAAAAWRLMAVFCLTAVLLHAWREAVDELVPVASYFTRSLILTYGLISIFVSAGAWTGWRTGRLAGGPLIAMLTSFVGWLGAWAVAASLPLSGAPLLHPGGIDEMFLLPVMMLPLVLVLGTFGAVLGTAARRLTRSRRAD